jgi:hypothetical protein
MFVLACTTRTSRAFNDCEGFIFAAFSGESPDVNKIFATILPTTCSDPINVRSMPTILTAMPTLEYLRIMFAACKCESECFAAPFFNRFDIRVNKTVRNIETIERTTPLEANKAPSIANKKFVAMSRGVINSRAGCVAVITALEKPKITAEITVNMSWHQ